MTTSNYTHRILNRTTKPLMNAAFNHKSYYPTPSKWTYVTSNPLHAVTFFAVATEHLSADAIEVSESSGYFLWASIFAGCVLGVATVFVVTNPLSPVVVTGYAVINGVTTAVTHTLLTNQIFVSGAVVIKGVMAAPAVIKGVMVAPAVIKGVAVGSGVAKTLLLGPSVLAAPTVIKGVAAAAVLFKSSPVTAAVVKGTIVVAKYPTTLFVAKAFLPPLVLSLWGL